MKLVRFVIHENFVSVSCIESEEVLLKFPVDEPNLKFLSKANHYFNHAITTKGEVNYSQIDIDYVLESTKTAKKIIASDGQIEFSIYPSHITNDDIPNPMVMIAEKGCERVEIAIMYIQKPVAGNDVFNSSKYKPKIDINVL